MVQGGGRRRGRGGEGSQGRRTGGPASKQAGQERARSYSACSCHQLFCDSVRRPGGGGPPPPHVCQQLVRTTLLGHYVAQALSQLSSLGLAHEGRAVYVCLLGVLPPYRRRGLGRSLMQQIINSARTARWVGAGIGSFLWSCPVALRVLPR